MEMTLLKYLVIDTIIKYYIHIIIVITLLKIILHILRYSKMIYKYNKISELKIWHYV